MGKTYILSILTQPCVLHYLVFIFKVFFPSTASYMGKRSLKIKKSSEEHKAM